MISISFFFKKTRFHLGKVSNSYEISVKVRGSCLSGLREEKSETFGGVNDFL